MNETLARHSVQDAKRRSYMALGVPLARIPLHVLPSVAASDVERPENDLRLVSAAPGRPPAETCESQKLLKAPDTSLTDSAGPSALSHRRGAWPSLSAVCERCSSRHIRRCLRCEAMRRIACLSVTADRRAARTCELLSSANAHSSAEGLRRIGHLRLGCRCRRAGAAHTQHELQAAV